MKTEHISICLFAALLVTAPIKAQTLEQAVSITLATNPEIKSLFNDFMSSRSRHDAANGAYLPEVNFDAGIGYERINPAESLGNESTDLNRKEASISLRQLIWDGASTLNDMDRTAADAESLRYQLLSDAEDKALAVSKVYLDCLKAEEVLALSEANLAVHKTIYKNVQKRVKSGLASTADLTQIQARLAKSHGNLAAAQNNLYDSHTLFFRLVGQSPQDLIFPRADLDYLPQSLEQAINLATENNPVIHLSQADVDSARFQYQQSKGRYYPTFYVDAAQTWYDDADGIRGDSDELIAMLRMQFNLYRGGQDEALAESYAYQLNKSKDLRERAFRSVTESLRLSWTALDLALQQKEFLADQVDAAAATLTAYEKQYAIGKRTLLDVLNTENELFNARKGYLDAKYAEQFAKFRMLNTTGQILSAMRVDIPKEWTMEVEY